MIDHSELVALAQRSGVKVETIVKRHKKTAIPGIMIIDNRYRVMEGTRYPYSMSGKKIKASSEKNDSICLKRFRCIDILMLKCWEWSKESLIDILKSFFKRD